MIKIKTLIESIFSVFMLFMCVIKTHAKAYSYRWDNTTVKIRVGSSIEDYKEIPRAKLYVDGILMSDAKITYDRKGDFLYYLKDVNTNVCGTYYVWYKAYENDKYRPGTCTNYRAKIKFDVIDDTSPEIRSLRETLNIQKGTVNNNDELKELLKSNIYTKDNYSIVDLSFNEYEVNLSQLGLYKIYAYAKDESLNVSMATFNLNIYDNNYPTLTCVNGDNIIYFNVGTQPSLKDLFVAYDKYDGDISSRIIFPKIDTSIIQEKEYTISVSNSSGNITNLDILVSIIDDIEPTITPIEENVIINYKTDFDDFDFKSLVKIEDNLEIDYDNLKYTFDKPLENKVGVYNIYYEYTDNYFICNTNIKLTLLSFDKPYIITDDVVINVNNKVDLLDYITVYDESDPNVKDNLVIDDTNVNYSESGTYYADVSCMNSSGEKTIQKLNIIIKNGNDIDNKTRPYIITIIVLIILIIGILTIIGIFYVHKRKKNYLKTE